MNIKLIYILPFLLTLTSCASMPAVLHAAEEVVEEEAELIEAAEKH